MSGKGQIFTPDFVASITLFSIFLLMFGIIWNSSIQMFLAGSNTADRQNSYAFNILKTSGQPDNWTSENVQVPGLYEDGKFSAEKFLEFYNLEVQDQRRLLRVQKFFMELQYLNGSTLEYDSDKYTRETLRSYSGPSEASLGAFPENSSVYVEEEIGLLEENGKRVKLQFYSWEN